MYRIQVFNKISPIISEHLPKKNYNISDQHEGYEAALVRSADLHSQAFPPEFLALARAGAGVNNIPIDLCSEKGIVVFNTPGANANAVRELVLCSLLLSGRDIAGGIQWVRGLKKDIESLVEKEKGRFTGPELAGKTLGVIGLGAIGVLVANTAFHGLGMKVIGYDPYISVDAAWKLSRSVIQARNLPEVLSNSDFVTVHTPLTEQTKGLINGKTIAQMKTGAVLLNFARAALVEDKAVLSALTEGKLRRYMTDFPNELLSGCEGVVALPHLGASTPESEENCASMAAEQLRLYLEEGTIINSVNLPPCEMPRNGMGRLCIINRNITNMVGQITGVLAAEKINIEDMLNKSRGAWAYTLIDLSQRPGKAALEKIKAIDGVVRLRLI